MMNRILIKVEVPDRVRAGVFKELYRHQIDFDASLSLPVQTVYDGLKVLYPESIITFSIG